MYALFHLRCLKMRNLRPSQFASFFCFWWSIIRRHTCTSYTHCRRSFSTKGFMLLIRKQQPRNKKILNYTKRMRCVWQSNRMKIVRCEIGAANTIITLHSLFLSGIKKQQSPYLLCSYRIVPYRAVSYHINEREPEPLCSELLMLCTNFKYGFCYKISNEMQIRKTKNG